jgi:hypothetical protein
MCVDDVASNICQALPQVMFLQVVRPALGQKQRRCQHERCIARMPAAVESHRQPESGR